MPDNLPPMNCERAVRVLRIQPARTETPQAMGKLPARGRVRCTRRAGWILVRCGTARRRDLGTTGNRPRTASDGLDDRAVFPQGGVRREKDERLGERLRDQEAVERVVMDERQVGHPGRVTCRDR